VAYHFRNLVFEGGRVKGIAYVGATGVLKKKGILEAIGPNEESKSRRR
jgi:NTE family protein